MSSNKPSGRAVRACPICSATRAELYLEVNGYPWVRCNACGLLFLAKVPFVDSSQFYADYYVSRRNAGRRVQSDADWSQWDVGSQRQFQSIAESCSRRRTGRLLDVGCGAGFFMDVCRTMGFEVEGIELALDAAEYAEQVLGLRVMRQPIDEIDKPPESYDVISFNNVLEHLVDPMGALRTAFRLLAIGGVLTVSVPNATFGVALRAITSILGHVRAMRAVVAVQVFQAPVHLTAFSRDTLALAVETCGFEAIELESEYPIFNPHRNIWNASKLVQYYGSEVIRQLTRQRLLVGHGITLYATKSATNPPL